MDLPSYLSRIGLHAPLAPTLETLASIVTAHTRTIPFENLDPLAGVPVRLDAASLHRKLVEGGRGGYCFEHNLLLLRALAALGYDAVGLIARVRWNVPSEGATTARSHMVIRVELDGPWIVDVGFGGQTLTAPLKLVPGLVQQGPHEPWRLLQDQGIWELQTELAGQWRAVYRFDLQPQEEIDYEVANWWTQAHPTSHFRSMLIAARVDGPRRLALRNAELTVHHPAAPTERQRLDSVEAVVGVLRDRFHVAVPDDPALRQAIARVLAP